MGYDTAEGLPRQNSAEDPSGVYGDECGTPTYREQLAQAIRPFEDMTVTKLKTKLAAAWVDPARTPATGTPTSAASTHDERTQVGDFKSADGATASIWITEHGKLGEYVCHTFTGTTQTSDAGWQDDYTTPVGTNAANTANLNAFRNDYPSNNAASNSQSASNYVSGQVGNVVHSELAANEILGCG